MKFPQVIDLFRRTFLEDTPLPTPDIIEQIFNAYNDERVSRGIAKLKLNRKLALAARNYAARLHTDGIPTSVTDIIIETGYRPRVVGENTARGYTSVSSVMSAWMVSVDHRRNILRPCYTEVGIAILDECWCAIFGDQGPTTNGDITVNLTGGPVHAPLCG